MTERRRIHNDNAGMEEDLDQPLSEAELAKISCDISKWEVKAFYLGLTAVQIENIRRNNHDYEMQKIAMLIAWANNVGSEATLRNLRKVLREEDKKDSLVESILSIENKHTRHSEL